MSIAKAESWDYSPQPVHGRGHLVLAAHALARGS